MFHDKTEYHSTIAWQNLPLRVLSWWLFEPSCSWRVPRCRSSPRLPNIAGAPTGSTMPTIWKSKLKKSQVIDNKGSSGCLSFFLDTNIWLNKKKDFQKTKLPNQWGIYPVCFNLGSKTFLKSLKVLYYDPDLTQFIKQNSKRVLIYILREHFQANKTQMNIKSPDLQSRRQLKSAIKNLFFLVLSMESNDILHRPL